MKKTDRPLREIYGEYVKGRIPFEDVKRATDKAVESFERSRGRASSGSETTPPRKR